METASTAATTLADRISADGAKEAASLIEQGAIDAGSIRIELNRHALATHLGVDEGLLDRDIAHIQRPFTHRKRGQEVKIIAGDRARQPDGTLIAALRKAHVWADQIKTGTPIKDIARDASCTGSYIRRIVPLATLSPRIQMAILDGSSPPDVTLERLIRSPLPIGWIAQETQLGFAA